MGNQILKENFIGKYDGVTPAALIPYGGVSDGLNMRKISPTGGWKARKGCTLHNTSPICETLDFTTFTEVDGPGKVTVTADTITLAAGDRDEDYYVTYDYGANYFGDFTHWVDVNVTSVTDSEFNSNMYLWALSNSADDLKDIKDLSGDALWVYAKRKTSNTHYDLIIQELNVGTASFFGGTDVPIAVNTPSYLAISRNGTTMIVEIYSTAALRLAGGSGDVDTLQGTIFTQTFRYLYGLASYNNGQTAKDISGTVSNLTIISDINGLHKFLNPRSNNYHFFAQCNSKIYKSPQNPPTAAAATAWTDMGVTVGTGDSYSCVVNETFYYADGSGRPIVYGGTTPYPIGVFTYDNSETAYNDFTRFAIDQNSSNIVKVLGAANDKLYIITSEICEAFAITMGTTKNSNAVTMTLKSWQSTAWSDRTVTDGTLDTGKSMAQSGSLTWTRSTSDTMRVIGNVMGYAYEISWSGAMSGTVDVTSITSIQDASAISNKWNGYWEQVLTAQFFDTSASTYTDHIQDITNEATSQYMEVSLMATGDFIYIKTPEPATGFGFAIVPEYDNTDAGNIDNIEYWDGDSWVATAGIVDGTLNSADTDSFAQTGRVFFDAAVVTSVYPRTLEGDNMPGYWYRVSVDATLSDDVRIFYIVYAPFPKEFPVADGVEEFKGRLMFWGPEKGNRLGYTSRRRGDTFAGFDSWYTPGFGDQSKILTALKFYNELVIFKRNSVYFLEGYTPETFGSLEVSDTVGLASPKTAHVAEVGTPGMHEDEPMSILIWQSHDGVYILDGRKPRKVSGPVDHYFNPEYATAISASDIESLEAFVDQNNNEYHLLLPTAELVYNFATDEWYPPWERSVDLTCGLGFKGADNRRYTYGGDANGFVYRLENDTSDKTVGNADVAISHSLKSRAIPATQEKSWERPLGSTFAFTLRGLWAELKARSAGTLTTKTFKNMATTGTEQSTPAALSMVNAGHYMAIPRLDMSITGCNNFQAEFSLSVVDQEMEIWGLIYEMEVIGKIGL